jgi:hypothetical protein
MVLLFTSSGVSKFSSSLAEKSFPDLVTVFMKELLVLLKGKKGSCVSRMTWVRCQNVHTVHADSTISRL